MPNTKQGLESKLILIQKELTEGYCSDKRYGKLLTKESLIVKSLQELN